jgi:hypothetical protein
MITYITKITNRILLFSENTDSIDGVMISENTDGMDGVLILENTDDMDGVLIRKTRMIWMV